MVLNEPRGNARLALIDFGLVASIKQEDMDTMISSIIHLANRDYPSLVDDFIKLEILPVNTDRPKVIPLMDKALTPYVCYLSLYITINKLLLLIIHKTSI